MTKEFSPEDFEPIYQQTLVLTIAIAENSDSALTVLLDDLTTVHTHLSSLIAKASNPNSLLRKRCSDRHGEWLQIQYDLQHTLCEAHDLIDSLAKSNVMEIVNAGIGLQKVEEELSVHAFLVGQFIESLGLSKLGRKEPALGEIERILIDAAREEREKLGRETVVNMPEVNRLGGWHRICRLLEKNGVDRREIGRLDTRIKQLIVWVFSNEEDITLVSDLEGFGELGKEETAAQSSEKSTDEQTEHAPNELIDTDRVAIAVSEVAPDDPSGLNSEEFEEVLVGGLEEQTQQLHDLVHITPSEGHDTESLDSYVMV